MQLPNDRLAAFKTVNMIYTSSSFSAISLPGMGSFKINSYDIVVHKSGVSLSIARVAYDCVVQTSLAGTS
jgi:hypothetical protein